MNDAARAGLSADAAESPRDGRASVLLVFGGRSSEHSVSCATAAGVLRAIDRDRYRVIPVGVARDGTWVLGRDDPEALGLSRASVPEVHADGSHVLLPEAVSSREAHVERPGGGIDSLGDIDVVFPLLHGRYGEDGTIQGALELAGLPYVGSGVLASSLAMDKHLAKIVLRAAGLRVTESVTVSAIEWTRDADAVRIRVARLRAPLFVKPVRAGSSVGVSRVDDPDDRAAFEAAMSVGLAEDSRVLVEQGVAGREIEVAVLGGPPGEPSRASVPGEIVLRERHFYDYASKYLDPDAAGLHAPAALASDEAEEVRRQALVAFDAIGGEGLARVDFFLDADGFVVNEVNTLPGFTPISMFPRCWQASGLSYRELITELIEVGRAIGPR